MGMPLTTIVEVVAREMRSNGRSDGVRRVLVVKKKREGKRARKKKKRGTREAKEKVWLFSS